MSQPNSIPPRENSPHLITPTNTPPPIPTQLHHHQQQRKQSQSGSHPMMENLDHRQHLLAIFSQGTHSFCQEDREEQQVERRKSFVEQCELSYFNFA